MTEFFLMNRMLHLHCVDLICWLLLNLEKTNEKKKKLDSELAEYQSLQEGEKNVEWVMVSWMNLLAVRLLAVVIYLTSISFASWQTLMKWKRTSMCFVLWWSLGLLVSSIEEMLSHIRGSGCFQSGMISSRRRRNHTLSLAASHAATYSASVVDSAMHCCRRELHAIDPPFRIKMKPDVDCRVWVFPA